MAYFNVSFTAAGQQSDRAISAGNTLAVEKTVVLNDSAMDLSMTLLST